MVRIDLDLAVVSVAIVAKELLEAVEAVGFEVSWICLVLAVFELLSVKSQ